MQNQKQFISSRRLALEIAQPTQEYSQRAAYIHRARLARMVKQWERKGAALLQPTR